MSAVLFADEPSRRTSPPMPPFITPTPTPSATPSRTGNDIPAPRKYGWFVGRIFDSETRRLIAATVELHDEDGELAGGPAPACPLWVRGTFRIRLPEGLYRLKVTKGPFYAPYKDTPYIEISRDNPVKLDIPMTPWGNVVHEGWASFDPFVHTAMGKAVDPVPTMETTALISEARGLDVVFLAEPWWHDPPPNIDTFDEPGKLSDLAISASSDGIKVSTAVAYDNRPYFGHFYRLGGAAPKPVELPDDPHTPNLGYMEKAREGGAAVVVYNPSRISAVRMSNSPWSHMTRSTALFGELYKLRAYYASELPYDLEAGAVDAIDIQTEGDWRIWVAALNAGYRVSAVSSSHARTGINRIELPLAHNYAFVRGRPDGRKVVQAIRKGATVVAKGPFIDFRIDSQLPGSVIAADGDTHYAHFKIFAPVDGDSSIKKIELLRNGVPLQSYTADSKTPSARRSAIPASFGCARAQAAGILSGRPTISVVSLSQIRYTSLP
ncbi:MAG: hypothetical protein U5N86_01385 [Planctomycetota bacterium]|nr:hypothetical protein [Planctomycetota bacterium]